MLAELCVFKIHWMLRRPERSVLDSGLASLQNEGLRCLEEADIFFTLKREESTWSSNFEGLEDRERATLLENSWRLPQIAVQLLNSGTEQPNEDIREQIWEVGAALESQISCNDNGWRWDHPICSAPSIYVVGYMSAFVRKDDLATREDTSSSITGEVCSTAGAGLAQVGHEERGATEGIY